MSSHRLIILAAACTLCGQITLADTKKNEIIVVKTEDAEKPRRDVNIIGPIPARYRGQGTGQTTFDGIQADELQLPTSDVGQFQAQSTFTPRFGQSRTQSALGSQMAGFGQFQAESRPDVYNFDGNDQVTYDGVLASDLMVPYATAVNQQARSTQPQYFRQRLPQSTVQQPAFQSQPLKPVVRQANFADNYRDDLRLPSSAPRQLGQFQQAGSLPNTADPSLFQPETPLERYNRVQQQYHATLAEYRNSLIRYQQQLKKYSTSLKKK